MNNQLSEILTPEVLNVIENLQDSGEGLFIGLAAMRNRFIDLSFTHDEIDFMPHIRDIQLLEELITSLIPNRTS